MIDLHQFLVKRAINCLVLGSEIDRGSSLSAASRGVHAAAAEFNEGALPLQTSPNGVFRFPCAMLRITHAENLMITHSSNTHKQPLRCSCYIVYRLSFGRFGNLYLSQKEKVSKNPPSHTNSRFGAAITLCIAFLLEGLETYGIIAQFSNAQKCAFTVPLLNLRSRHRQSAIGRLENLSGFQPSRICFLQKSRFTESKPSIFAFRDFRKIHD